MALGTWKEDPQENAILQDEFNRLGGNEDIGLKEKMQKASQAHKIAGRTRIANQKNVDSSHDSSIYLSYPVARNNSEKTGDTLRIKCVEYLPPESGAGLGVTVKGAFFTRDGGQSRELVTNAMRKDEKSKFYKTKPSIKMNLEDANSRISRMQKTKYYIELPIPQEVNDSNSVTWGEDKVNALELAALSVASSAMGGGIGEMAGAAVEALNSGVNIPGLGPDTQDAVRAAISGKALNALGSQVSAESCLLYTSPSPRDS